MTKIREYGASNHCFKKNMNVDLLTKRIKCKRLKIISETLDFIFAMLFI